MTASLDKLLRDNGISLSDTRPGNHAAICPQCSSRRKKPHQKIKCLGVKIDDKGACWNCSHCGWSGPERGATSSADGERYRATHDYHDASGQYLYTKVRYPDGHDPKCRLRRRNGRGGWLGWGIGGKPRVLYRLPEVLAAVAAGKTIALVEGESDADALWKVGVPATCSRDGAAAISQRPKWLPEDSEQLRGADVVVLGDHDPPGYAHQNATAQACAGVARRVRVLKLADHWPNCPEGGDVRAWLAAGHTQEELAALMAKAPVHAPSAGSAGRGRVGLDNLLKSASDLQHKTFAPLRFIVQHYLPEGTNLLAGRPKIGKSWLALMVAVAVSGGGECLGHPCEQGDVLGLFLEDNDRRLQRRLTTMLGAQKEKWPERLTYATQWPRLNEGGLELIREWIKRVSNPRLVIIDILECVRPRAASGKQTQTQYSIDYEALATLTRLAADEQLSILVNTHQRKLNADDLIDTISGTLGQGGGVDAFLILSKDVQGHFLYGRGRDTEEFNVSVKLDERCRWQVLGRRVDVPSAERAAIVAALAKAGRPMTVVEITRAVNGDRDNIKQLLSKMHFGGEIERVAVGLYQLAKTERDLPF
jgi:hypothetical protein